MKKLSEILFLFFVFIFFIAFVFANIWLEVKIIKFFWNL